MNTRLGVATGWLSGIGLCLLLAVAVQAQDEVIEQWAQIAVAQSSRIPDIFGGPGSIVGTPDETACRMPEIDEEFPIAGWQPFLEDQEREWIEVKFERPVFARAVEVHEGVNPGTVTRLLVRNLEGQLHEVWSGEDPHRTCPAVLRLDFTPLDFPTDRVRVELNTGLVPGFNTLDAVKLIGAPLPDFQPLFQVVDQPFSGTDSFQRFNAFTDYDNDGRPDLLGWLPPLDFPHSLLQHNEGNGLFKSRGSLLPIPADPESFAIPIGIVSSADYDNDGDLDYYYPAGTFYNGVAMRDLLLRNDRGRFVDVTQAAGLHIPDSSTWALWLDYDNDGWPDLYVGHYAFPHTEGHADLQNTLFRNQGDGTFTDVTVQAGLDIAWHNADSPDSGGTFTGPIAGDFDDNGWTDLYQVVSHSPHRLLLNEGGLFRDATTPESGRLGPAFGGAAGDIDQDGDLDLFAPIGSNSGEDLPQRSAVLLNQGNERFIDFTEGLGLRSIAEGNILRGHLVDYDNDGDLDLFPADGLPSAFENTGAGLFHERTFQLGHSGVDAFFDFDGDGFLDIYHSEGLFRNRGNGHHFLRIDLVGTSSNRDGLGARVLALVGGQWQMRELNPSDGWFQYEFVVHFGLGEHTTVEQLEIRWPSGQVDFISNIPADQKIRVVEGRGEWYPAPRTVWTAEPPASVAYGQSVDFVAVARPTLFEPTATITSVVADLSRLGGPDAVPLTDQGDGTYRLESTFTIGGESELRDVSVLILQETSLGEHWINLSRNIEVQDDPFTAVLETRDGTVPDDFALNQNFPNPFNAGTVIQFSLPTASPVDLSVFNLAGQKVARLAEGLRTAGQYRLEWDGRDDGGRELASGVYLYRLQAEDRIETRKLLLLR
ncbi:MAG: T9SS type A sorting domain-containing protein [Candidatus Latescibacteria bacterium]|nr:T9SS type A sorting domain-containing protein [Candidatus Latescibacterota bacterium]